MGEHLRQLKGTLRGALRAERRARSSEEVCGASRAVCAAVLDLPAVRHARHLAVYVAAPGEIDPLDVVRAAMARRQAVYFPRVVGSGLEFLSCPLSALRSGAYGLAEPTEGRRLDPSSPDVVFLVPGLGFDPAGTRLGRGGGHYDRALAEYPAALRIGLACDAQIRSSLPREPWDQPMDAVVTERRVLWTAGRSGEAFEENLS
jgi:5-formyltetrahydrofolate cyclo-ligase